MIVRRRLKTLVTAVALHALAAGAIAYFGFHAWNGDRGLIAKETYRVQMAELSAELAALKKERADWSHRLSLIRLDNLDPDLIDERARDTLNVVHQKDIVWFVDKPAVRPTN
jgi:cell division protein FtsB